MLTCVKEPRHKLLSQNVDKNGVHKQIRQKEIWGRNKVMNSKGKTGRTDR